MSATRSTLLRPLAAALAAIGDHITRRAAVARLTGLDDARLKDLGLARHEIEEAVHGTLARSASGVTAAARPAGRPRPHARLAGALTK